MTTPRADGSWTVLGRTIEIRSPWLTLIGERLVDNEDRELDYWRVEKTDSLLVLTIHRGFIVLPNPSFRPGVGRVTLDLPGGRFDATADLNSTALTILQRELGLSGLDPDSIGPLNEVGWDVDSSSSNQMLFGATAMIPDSHELNLDRVQASYRATVEGGKALRDDLTCLQCRAVVTDWLERQPR